MAHSPRKPSPGSKSPAGQPPTDDLFEEPARAMPKPAKGDPDDNWTLEDDPATPSRPTSLPSPQSNTPEPVRISPISIPARKSFESNPPTDAEAESIPEALPSPKPKLEPVPPPEEPIDPFEIDEELPQVPPSSLPATPAADASVAEPSPAPNEKTDGVDELEGEPSPYVDRPKNVAAGLMAAGGVLVAILVLFIGILYANRPESGTGNLSTGPTVPLSGQVATLSSVESGWRQRQPGDLASTVDVTFPTPSRQQAALLPMVKFSIDPAASKNGYLRFIFFDPEGDISGDVRVVKIAGGTIDALSSGGIVTEPGSAVVYGSLGFMDRPGFVGYAMSEAARWSVEIWESTDYNAKEEGWTKLDSFQLSNATDP